MKPCEDLNVDLLRYLDNDLSEQEFKYLRAHLDACVYCQGRLERERALSRSLQESRPLYSAPAELRSQISAGEPSSGCNKYRPHPVPVLPEI